MKGCIYVHRQGRVITVHKEVTFGGSIFRTQALHYSENDADAKVKALATAKQYSDENKWPIHIEAGIL